MPGLAEGVRDIRPRTRRVPQKRRPARQHDLTATRMASADELMPPGGGWTIPRLGGIPGEHQIWHGQQLAARAAATFVRAGVARHEDWPSARGIPFEFLVLALDRWVADHGGAEISEVFHLHLTLSTSLDRYTGSCDPTSSTLYLTIEPDSAGYVVLGPTLRLLEPIHPRLPVTFVHMLIGALNKWVRVYDWRDALARVEQMREWHEMDPESAADVELPDIERSLPACMKRRPLARSTLEQLAASIHDKAVRELVEQALELEKSAEDSRRKPVTDDIAELLQDCGDPLPALLAVFEKQDTIEGQFDEESQGMLEVAPEPNTILKLNVGDKSAVTAEFAALIHCCAVLSSAAQLIKSLPGAAD